MVVGSLEEWSVRNLQLCKIKEFEYCATLLEFLLKKSKHTKMTEQTVEVYTEGRALTERALN